MKRIFILAFLLSLSIAVFAQKKVLFDATKAETAGNADWAIDEGSWNLKFSGGQATTGGSEGNPQRYPTPDQSEVTSSTSEDFWKGALSSWGIELVKAGYYVETLPYDGLITYGDNSNPQDLSHYDMYVVCEPNFSFTGEEKRAIINYVYNGGVLFMISDHNQSDRDGDGWDSPHIWNDLMQNNDVKTDPFGISFDYENFNDDTKKIVSGSNTPIINGPYGTVTNVEFYGGTSMTLHPNDNPTVTGLVYKGTTADVGGTNYVLVAYAKYGKGLVIAVGDSSPFDDGTGDSGDNLYDGWLEDANGCHRIMIMNASVWGLEKEYTSVEQTQYNLLSVKTFANGLSISAPAPGTIELVNMQGEILRKDNIRNSLFLNNLRAGIYLIRYISDKGQYVRKVVVY